MIRSRWVAKFGLAVCLAAGSAAMAQQRGGMHIGYVYPAGGEQGKTFEAVIGGQGIANAEHIYVSGGGVTAKIAEIIRPISGGELNKLRIEMDELMVKKAVVRNDFRTLQNYKNFKNAKDLKTDKAAEEKELAEFKKKYANATWTAADDKRVAEIRKKMSGSVRKPANPAICEIAVLEVTVAKNATPGHRELRVATYTGLSNPLVFCVSQYAEFSRAATKSITEQKSAVAKTAFAPKNRKPAEEMEVTLPAIVNGQIMPGTVDRFRFTAKKGQPLVVAASARELIPYLPDGVPGWFQATLAIYDAQGNEVAYDDDFRFSPDPVLYYEVPADGQYSVEIKDAIYRGREDFVYRITIGEMPFVTGIFPLGGPAGEKSSVAVKGWNLPKSSLTLDNKRKAPGIYLASVSKDKHVSNFVPYAVDTLPECLDKEPNNKPDAAQSVKLPITVNGRIDEPGDTDVFRFEGRKGDEIVAEVLARRLNSPLDSVLILTDASGKQVAMNDDHEDKGAGLTTHHADSYLRAALPAKGTYYLHLTDGQQQGGQEYAYRLRISPPRPDFDLRVVPSSITVRAGSSMPVTVYALRKDGFAGEIALALKGAPDGFRLSGGLVPAGQDLAKMTLSAGSASRAEPLSLDVEGRATIDGREVAHRAVPAEDMMQAFEYRHLVPSKDMQVAVLGRSMSKGALRILSDLPIKIPAGGTARIQLNVPSNILKGRVHLELSDPPEGITIKDVKASGDGTAIVLESDAAKVKPGLKGNLIVGAFAATGKSSSKGKPQAGSRGAPMATLPAIPFEVVRP